MDLQAPHVFFISAFFRKFYNAVLQQKKRVLSGQWLEQEPFGGEGSARERVKAIIQSFEDLLNEQSLQAHQHGGAFGVACYREAQYLMVALADETFLNLSWEGRAYWEDNLLEERLFATHVAGERFFQMLDDFLQERNILKKELGMLYLTCLGLGFQGKYRGSYSEDIFSRYRNQLFTVTYHKKPLLFEGQAKLCPQALLYTLGGSPEHKLYDSRKWIYGFLGIVFGYLVLSCGVWFSTTYPLVGLTKQILSDISANADR